MQKFRDVLSRWKRGDLSMMEGAELLGMSARQFRRYRGPLRGRRQGGADRSAAWQAVAQARSGGVMGRDGLLRLLAGARQASSMSLSWKRSTGCRATWKTSPASTSVRRSLGSRSGPSTKASSTQYWWACADWSVSSTARTMLARCAGAGRSCRLVAGGLSYGYAPVAGDKGKRIILLADAEIVRRILGTMSLGGRLGISTTISIDRACRRRAGVPGTPRPSTATCSAAQAFCRTNSMRAAWSGTRFGGQGSG
jgi:hypothetical protein